MSNPFFPKKRRGFEVSLVHLLEFALGVAVVIFLIYMSIRIGGLFIGRQDYDSTINNMQALADTIKGMVADRRASMEFTKVYSITDDYILVGFSNDDKGKMGTDCTQEEIIKSRLNLCRDQACLCIYKNYGGLGDIKGEDFDSRNNNQGTLPLKCITFDHKIVFISPLQYGNSFKGTESAWNLNSDAIITPPAGYENLVIYGQCRSEGSFGIKQLHINKVTDNDIHFIVIEDQQAWASRNKLLGGNDARIAADNS